MKRVRLVEWDALGLRLDVSNASMRSMLVPISGGVAACAISDLAVSPNHPEDFATRIGAVALAASETVPPSDSHFTRQSQGLIGDAVRAKTRAAEPNTLFVQVRDALKRDTEVDYHTLRLQGSPGGLHFGTVGPVLLLKP